MLDWGDTIVARITALGHAAVGIVRLSGERACVVADHFVFVDQLASVHDLPPRQLTNAVIRIDGAVWDRCLVVYFAAPRSFTGEDVVEIHLHGNPLIVEKVVECASAHGARLATAGEFTMRSVLNGKLDILQAEALGEVIAAESAAAVTIAQRQLGGELSRMLGALRDRVVKAIAQLELGLDFGEEGYSFIGDGEIALLLADLRENVATLLRSYRSGARFRRGPRVVLLGRPNAGKSSFFNAVLGYSRALVSDRPGTTRDYLEEQLVHRGVVLHLLDTAGLREADDPIEAEGARLSIFVAGEVDVVLYLIDASDRISVVSSESEIRDLNSQLLGISVIPVMTKGDLASVDPNRLSCSVRVSGSIDVVLDEVVKRCFSEQPDQRALVSERQSVALLEMSDILNRVSESLSGELVSAELRLLLRPLSSLVGEVTNEHVLDSVFRDFCIGK